MMRWWTGVAIAVALATTAACKRQEASAERGPARVVSLSPSTTEAMFAIGAGSQLVARSRYCSFPPEVAKLPQVGGYVDPSLEAILAVSPSLVIGARGPTGTALTDRLASRKVETYFPATESFAEISAMMLGLGERTGHATEAKEAVARVEQRVAAVERAVAGLPRVRVLLVFGVEPLSVAGPKSFPDEMIRRAGGTNVVSEGGAYPSLGMERVINLDPDVVVAAIMGEENAASRIGKDRPGWASVRAVREGHVVALSDEALLRPGPRIGDGLATLARAIHPDANVPPREAGP